jgi:hypothetical protein
VELFLTVSKPDYFDGDVHELSGGKGFGDSQPHPASKNRRFVKVGGRRFLDDRCGFSGFEVYGFSYL